ncbi:MAG: peptide ABC transporter substrate-binding protein [Dehalococcoidia bacterium]
MDPTGFSGWRKSLLGLISLLAILSFVAAACGDDDDGGGGDDTSATAEETPADDEATAAEQTPTEDEQGATDDSRQQGGEVTLNFLEPEEFDPHASSFAQDISFERMVWRGLYSLDRDNNVVFETNGIAAGDPEVSEDGLVYTITLNDGLLWSDGDDLTAEDFVAGFKRTCSPVVAGDYAYVLTDLTPVAGCADFFNSLVDADGNAIDLASVDLQALEDAIGVTAVDDLTLEITLAQPAPTFPIIMALWMTFPVPIHLDQFASQTADAPGEWGADPGSLAYNGPYVWTDYSTGDRAVVEPNPNWSGAVQPTLERIDLPFIDDAAVADNAFRNDELQFALADSAQLRQLEQEFGDEYLLAVVPTTRGVEMQLDDEVLSDLNVRLALAKAIDREALNEVVAQGGNIPTTSWIPEEISGVPIGTFDEAIGFDPEGAAALLAEAGYPNGDGFPTLSFLVGDTPAARATAEFFQQNYQEILGIDIEIEVVDSATRSARFTSEDFDLFPGGWVQDYPDPENWIVGLFNTDGGNNHYNCSLPEIDDLVAEAQYNQNNEERIEQYREIERLIVENVCGIAPYWHETNKYLIKANLVGFAEFATGQDAVIAGDWNAEAWGLAGE